MRPWPLVAICLGTFMLLVDVTIVNVALPSIAASLESSFTDLQWVIDGYALALAALLMVAGSLADRFGHRRLYLAGLAVFSLASLACGLAPTAGALVAARAVQGVGGAAMFATTAALIAMTYRGRERGVAFGIWGAVNGLAAASGPVLGGLLTELWSWRGVFLVNLPIAAVAVVITLAVLPADRPSHGARIDLAGAAAFTLAAGALVYGLISAGERGWGTTTTVVALGLAAIALVGFVVVERTTTAPMLDLALFADRSFTAIMVAAAVLSAAAFSHLALISIWLQTLLDLTPIRAGLVTLPLSLAAFVVSAAAGRFLHGDSPAFPIGGGLALIGVGALLLTLLGPGSGAAVLIPGIVVIGLGVGLATPVLVSAALAVLPPARAGIAGAAVNTFRQLGLAVGLAVFGTVFAGRASAALGGDDAGTALAGGRAGEVVGRAPGSAPAVHAAFAAGLDRVFVVGGVAALVAAVVVVVFLRPARTPEPAPAAAAAAAP